MLAGHLAVALGAKRIEPRLPLAGAVAAAFALDLAWPLLLLAGLESVTVHPGDTAFTHLQFDAYPWSHSLATVLLWSALAGVATRATMSSMRVGLLVGALVASHWVLDFVTHRPDLPLWPGGPLAGLGLWNSVAGTLVVEGALLAAGVWAFTRTSRARDAIGRWAFRALVALIGLIWVTQPWSPPPPSPTAVAWGGLVFWLILPWASWIERHRTLAGPAGRRDDRPPRK